MCVRVRLFDDLSIRKCSGSRHAPECFGMFNPSRLVCSTKMVKLQATKTARQISGWTLRDWLSNQFCKWVCLLEGDMFDVALHNLPPANRYLNSLYIISFTPRSQPGVWGWHRGKPISPQSHYQPKICLANMVPNLWGGWSIYTI